MRILKFPSIKCNAGICGIFMWVKLLSRFNKVLQMTPQGWILSDAFWEVEMLFFFDIWTWWVISHYSFLSLFWISTWFQSNMYLIRCWIPNVFLGVCSGTSDKEPTGQSRRCKRRWFNPCFWKIPWRRACQPTLVLLPGKSHGQKSLAGYSSWGRKESDWKDLAHQNVVFNCRFIWGELYMSGSGINFMLAL